MSRQSLLRSLTNAAAAARLEHGLGNRNVALADLAEARLERGILLLGQGHQAAAAVGDAAAGRQHDRLTAGAACLDDARDATEAVGIGDARAAELVDYPGIL